MKSQVVSSFILNVSSSTRFKRMIQRVFLSKKQANLTKFGVSRAILKASAGHIWPAGRMLCMFALECHVLF